MADGGSSTETILRNIVRITFVLCHAGRLYIEPGSYFIGLF